MPPSPPPLDDEPPEGRAGSHLVRSSLLLVLNQAMVSGAGFLFWILAARHYPPSEVGTATSAIGAAVFLGTVATLGLPFAITRHLASAPDPARLVAQALRMTVALASAVAVLALALVPLWSPRLASDLFAAPMALGFAVLLISYGAEAVFEQALVAARRTELTTAMLSVFAFLRLPFPLLGLAGGAADLVLAWAIAMGLAVAVTGAMLAPGALGVLRPGAPPISARSLVGYAAANHAGNIAALAGPMLLPTFILNVGGATGAGDSAHFYVAFSVAQLLYVVPAAVALAQFAEGARPGANRRAGRTAAMRLALGLVVPGSLVLALASPWVLGIFGATYAARASGLLGILSLAALPAVLVSVLATRFRLADRLGAVVAASSAWSAVALGGALLWLPSAGLPAVGWSYLAGATAAAGILFVAGRTLPPETMDPLPIAHRSPRSESDRGPAAGATVMILNWNAGVHLLRCVESVLATAPKGTRVVVIDNASADGSIEPVAALAGVEVVRNGANLGFAGAYNRAILPSTEEFVVLLNPDTIARGPGWLEALVARARADPALAAVSCKLLFAHDPHLVNSVGAMAYWWTGPVDIGFGQPDSEAFGGEMHPFAPSGGAMLVRPEAFREADGFDEAMFAYGEDLDLGWRLRLRGWDVGYEPRAELLHVFSSTTGAISPKRVYLTHRNFLRAMLKNYAATTLVRALPAFAAWTLTKAGGALILERSGALAVAPLRAVGWNAVMLTDTLRARREVQRTRRTGDAEILDRMGPRGFEPTAHVLARREVARARMGVTPP